MSVHSSPASDVTALDRLIEQWRERAANREATSVPKGVSAIAKAQRECADELEAALAASREQPTPERKRLVFPRTTLITAAAMLDACAEHLEPLAVGYGAAQMQRIAEHLRQLLRDADEGTIFQTAAKPAVPPVPVEQGCSFCAGGGPFVSTDDEAVRICGTCAGKFAKFLNPPVPVEGLDLEPIEAREQLATEGPWGWTYDGSGDYSVGLAEDPQAERYASMWATHRLRVQTDHDADFIAHARADIPHLVAEVKRLRARLAAVEGATCRTCHGRGWVLRSESRDLGTMPDGSRLGSGGVWNEACPDCAVEGAKDDPFSAPSEPKRR